MDAYRVESYRSNTTVSTGMTSQLRCYFVTKCQFNSPNPTPEQETDLNEVADQNFLKKATEHTHSIYQDVMRNVLQRTGPVIEMYDVQGTRERRLIIGYRQRSTQGFFSAMSDLYHYYDLYSSRKYVGKLTFSWFLFPFLTVVLWFRAIFKWCHYYGPLFEPFA
jgi:glutamate dehydrogenase